MTVTVGGAEATSALELAWPVSAFACRASSASAADCLATRFASDPGNDSVTSLLAAALPLRSAADAWLLEAALPLRPAAVAWLPDCSCEVAYSVLALLLLEGFLPRAACGAGCGAAAGVPGVSAGAVGAVTPDGLLPALLVGELDMVNLCAPRLRRWPALGSLMLGTVGPDKRPCQSLAAEELPCEAVVVS